MRFMKMLVAAGFISLVAVSPAFAFGGGGGHKDAQVASAAGSAVSSLDSTGGGAPTVATSEPLALFAVGLGLLGARFLRRR